MNIKNLVSLAVLVVCFSYCSKVQDNMSTNKLLTAKEQSFVSISAFTAQNNMPKLASALNQGLGAGLTISEVKEMLVQLYAYTGFPRSLNALNNLTAVVNERKNKGIADAAGKEPSPYPSEKTMLQTGTENQTKLTGAKIGGGVYDFPPALVECANKT